MYDIFVNNLRTIRRQTGLTQEKLAERCAVSPTFIGEMEIGKRTPSFDTIKKIAEALGVKPYRLFMEKQPEMILDEEFVHAIIEVIRETVRTTINETIEGSVEQAIEKALEKQIPYLLETLQSAGVTGKKSRGKKKHNPGTLEK